MNRIISSAWRLRVLLAGPHYQFALSKRALKALYAVEYIRAITLPNFSSAYGLANQIQKKRAELTHLCSKSSSQTSTQPADGSNQDSQNSLRNSTPKQDSEVQWPVSLRDLLLSRTLDDALSAVGKKVEDQDKKLMEEAKQQMQALFKEGIDLPKAIFRQERFQDALSISQTIFNVQKFVFFPTFLVTGQIFNIINYSGSKLLFSGEKGTSKSTAFVLRWALENQICSFWVREYNDDQQILAISKIMRPRKFIYWNIDRLENYNISGLKQYCLNILQSLYLQCPQFQPQLNEKYKEKVQQIKNIKIESQKQNIPQWQLIKHIEEFIWEIRKLYSSSNVEINILVDQINGLFSHVRKANQLAVKRKDQLTPHELQKWETQYHIAIFLEELRKVMVSIASRKVFYNSSLNIEDLEKVQGKPVRQTIKIHLQDREIRKEKLMFSEPELNKVRSEEMKHFLAFEVQRQRPTIGVELIRKIAKQFGENKFKLGITPFIIRKLIQKFPDDVSGQATQNYLSRFTIEMMRQDNIQSYIRFVSEKASPEKKMLNFHLLNVAAKKGTDQPGIQEAPFKMELTDITPSAGFKVKELIDKQFFSIYWESLKDGKGEAEYIQSIFTINDMVEILNTLNKKQVFGANFADYVVKQMELFVSLSGNNLGNVLQLYMISALQPGHFLKLDGKNYEKQFEINSVLPAVWGNKHNQASLKEIFTSLSQQKPNTMTLYVPFTQDTLKLFEKNKNVLSPLMIKQWKSPNAFALDFVIVDMRQDNMEFNLFQLTVQKNETEEKLKNALRFITEVKEFYKPKMTLTTTNPETRKSEQRQLNLKINVFMIRPTEDSREITESEISQALSFNNKKTNQSNDSYDKWNQKLKQDLQEIMKNKVSLRAFKCSFKFAKISPTDSINSQIYKGIAQIATNLKDNRETNKINSLKQETKYQEEQVKTKP